MNREYPVVEVWWDDAASSSGWHSETEALGWARDRYRCRSAGLLISDTKLGLTLATNLNCYGGLGDLMRIPRGMVLKVRIIAKAEKAKK